MVWILSIYVKNCHFGCVYDCFVYMHIHMYIHVIFLKYCYVYFITDSVDGIDTDKDVVEEHTNGKGMCIQN